jgi:precorrin-6A/cobalt-precorrin-6A reductase
VFLTQGRLQLAAFATAPQHFYLVRAIDEPAELVLLANRQFVSARGPFALQDELALMREQKIEILVSKNSGGEATSAKLLAARMLGVKVVLVARPPVSDATEVFELDDVLRWLGSHRPPP